MDLEEARRILFTRVQSFDSENAFKIMGYLLIQDWSEQELLQLALGSDVILHSLVAKAKKELGLSCKSSNVQPGQTPLQQASLELNTGLPITQALNPPFMQVVANGCQSPSNESFVSLNQSTKFGCNKPNSYPPLMLSQMSNQWPLPRLTSFQGRPSFPLEDHDERHTLLSGSFDVPGQLQFKDQNHLMNMPAKWASSSVVDATHAHASTMMTWKPCLFFLRGYCKHGSNCRFLHYSEMDVLTPLPHTEDYSESAGSDDGILSPMSLDCLEQELRELLRGRQIPVSIASLPQLYYERFGKSLQAEGYLTESQRHGKVGYSLTKLLMKLKGTVTLIERFVSHRPHGQHAVLLSEDAHRFMEARGNQDGFYASNPSSRQIYLTFPPESTFTEEDVTLHFRAYGPVQDVRIPYQQKRMFGFVTFVYPDTVTSILAEGNPHYICGARVLVKPYKEKGKISDRKLHDHHFKYMPASNHLPAVGYQRDDQFSRHVEDDLAISLEKKMLALELTASQDHSLAGSSEAGLQQFEKPTPPADVGVNVLDADDAYPFQSNTFKYVLDLIEGESKDADIAASAISAGPRLNTHTVDDTVHSSNISTTTAQKVKVQNLQPQNAFLGQYSWGAPTLFARSVF